MGLSAMMPQTNLHEQSQEVPLWMIIVLVLSVGFMFGAIFHPFTGDGGSQGMISYAGPTPDPAIADFARAQIAAMTPTYSESPTPVPTGTPKIIIVTPTWTPTQELPWCDYAQSGDDCYLPGIVPTPVNTPYACDEMTPKPYAYICRKIDVAGTGLGDQVERQVYQGR